MIALKHSGMSANIDYYGEPGPERIGSVWCEVLCRTLHYGGGQMTRRKLPIYSVAVHVVGKGIVGSFTYEPKTRPAKQGLPDRTVTRLVREHCQGL